MVTPRPGDTLRDTNRATSRVVLAVDDTTVTVQRRGGGKSRIAVRNLHRYTVERRRGGRTKNANDRGLAWG